MHWFSTVTDGHQSWYGCHILYLHRRFTLHLTFTEKREVCYFKDKTYLAWDNGSSRFTILRDPGLSWLKTGYCTNSLHIKLINTEQNIYRPTERVFYFLFSFRDRLYLNDLFISSLKLFFWSLNVVTIINLRISFWRYWVFPRWILYSGIFIQTSIISIKIHRIYTYKLYMYINI